ncbi:MAG: entericidin, EcnA/B family [Confluentimicrobium sp.]|jgi:predicted small secreted protein|uniref:Putative small secreted protein n=1 Tax=Actibacterium naphthalenivorans TaxID=1614693 RepID=A0A840CHC0_9RHOB|nr:MULTISPECIES: entericidin A/B family lipoprotein [Actibacterium]MBB4022186.1 putative small secreted protein [Actibacterium naphthalenivorans]MBC57667.1 entericidin, EcnA/B family [Actibacterium sp.]MDY6861041.1 entericidin A/B family lipoprotein [Pseudomonadota bacterium]|tara:strand:- start:440 stop:553 length:114 start_codon:yes stop_codon:yes gene_type:complete
MSRIIVLAALMALAGCATIEGIGEDISSGSRAVQNAL